MNLLPGDIREALAAQFGPLRSAQPLSGGDVNRAAQVATSNGSIFVKWKQDPPGFFALEADGLDRLRAADALRIPRVLQVGEAPAFLALEYLEPVVPRDERQFGRLLGEGLASLHRAGLALDGRFGLERDNFLGSQPQVNTPHGHWSTFYRDCRLVPQWEKARGRNLVPPHRERLLGRVVETIGALLGGFEARPVLIHGDLWSGNFLATVSEAPALIDPAVYYAEREVEMAFTQLFGGFPRGYFESYCDVFPLDAGYGRRRPIHQLYPLLVHLNHFGETYGPAVDRACRESLAE